MIAPAHYVIVIPSRNSLNGYAVNVTKRSHDTIDPIVRNMMFSPRFRALKGVVAGLPPRLSGVNREIAEKLLLMMVSADQIDDPKTVTLVGTTLLNNYITDRCFWIEAAPHDLDWDICFHSVQAGYDPVLALKQVPVIDKINRLTGKLDEVINLGTITHLNRTT